ncbi:MAG: hypothetical protein ACI819_002267 [Neolewinella sp.]
MGEARYVDVLLCGSNCHLSNLLTGCIENYRFAFAVQHRQVVHYGVRGNTGTRFQVSAVAYADDLGIRTVQVDLLEAVVSHLAGQWRTEVRVVVLAEAGLIDGYESYLFEALAIVRPFYVKAGVVHFFSSGSVEHIAFAGGVPLKLRDVK